MSMELRQLETGSGCSEVHPYQSTVRLCQAAASLPRCGGTPTETRWECRMRRNNLKVQDRTDVTEDSEEKHWANWIWKIKTSLQQ